MKWLKNFERVQEIQQQIIWQPVSELDPRAFIPEVRKKNEKKLRENDLFHEKRALLRIDKKFLQFLKATLHRQPCERLLASPKRQLLHEGPLTLLGRLISFVMNKSGNRAHMC